MKFLYFGDRHYRVTAPENRMDDYQESLKAKDKEIIELGKKHKVSAFLQPGDFWDTANPPLDFASNVIQRWSNVNIFEVLNKMASKTKVDKDLFINNYLKDLMSGKFVDVEEAIKHLESEFSEEDFEKEKNELEQKLKDYIPIIGIAGNHELYGNNLNTLPKTMLGFMEKLGVMRFATKDNPYYFYTEDGLKIAITGTHYHLDIDSPEHIDDYVVDEKLGDYHIHIVHGYLTDKSKGDMFRHTLIDQIKHTKADVTISGHDHIGFPLTEIDGKFFVNTGAIPRLSNDLKEINRKVKVLLIDITKDNGLKLKEIPLKSVKDGELILNRTKIVERKKKEQRLEEFKKSVREAGVKKATDITEIVRDIADNRELPVDVKNSVVERISEKMSTMKAQEEGVVEEAYVERLILENFQSHEYTELEFSKGFNIFVGESKQGKSSALRAFSWIYENKPAGKRIIRKGADYSKVTVFLSNGYIISRYIESKKGGKNGYEITDPNTGEVEYHNTKILPEIQKLVGYSPLYIDKDLQFNLNFMKQGAGWFLIGDQYSAPQKAKIIGGIYGTQYADAVIRDIDSETKRSNENIKKATESLQKTDERLKDFDYLPNLKTSIEFVEAQLKEIEALKARKEKITHLLGKHENLMESIQRDNQTLESLKDLDNTSRILSEVKMSVNKRDQLETVLDKHMTTSKNLNLMRSYLSSLRDLDRTKGYFKESLELVEKRNTIEKTVQKHENIVEKILVQNKIVSQTENTEKAGLWIQSIYKGLDRRNAIERLIVKHEGLLSSIHKEANLLEKTSKIEEAKKVLMTIQQDFMRASVLEGKVVQAEKLEEKAKGLAVAFDKLKRTITSTTEIEETRNQFERIKSLLEHKEKLAKVLIQREKLIEQVNKENQQLSQVKVQIEKNIELYQALLEEEGKCPVCFGTINKTTVNRIVQEFTDFEVSH